MTRPSSESLRILSWNVNGLRACDRKGFRRWLDRSGAFLVGIQEVRARLEDLPRRLAAPRRWFCHLVAAEKKGYSGVGVYAAEEPDDIDTTLGVPEFDREGRVQILRYGQLVVANVYFPNGSGPNRDHSRVPYKLDFYRALFERLDRDRRAGRRVVCMGDYNTAHREIDLARPKQNRKTSGFLSEERSELDRWLAAGWVDSFRHFEPGEGHYTWWSQRRGVREKNIGWRIDYVLTCQKTVEHLDAAHIFARTRGSDHCPVGIDLDARITGP